MVSQACGEAVHDLSDWRDHGVSLSMNQIAIEIGFSSPVAFARAFKRYGGITPKRYRELDDTI
ncbi:hypothetical protein FACS189492_1490 [Clostridia bacterium]|nr:hypothetical protein FACS189492_1490 [Clostridia bacterium]